MPRGKFLLPAIIDPPSRVAVCLCIPNEPQHIAAFWGALRVLAYQHEWERDDDHSAIPVSTLWAEILQEANIRFNEGDMMCVSQQELQQLITNSITQNNATVVNQIRYGDQAGSPPGTPLTSEESSANLAFGSNPDCDKDILWAQCVAVVNYAHRLIIDALEIAETATNDTELLGALLGLPLIQEIGGAAIADYVDLLLEGVAENYAAQVTDNWLSEVEYKIFCTAKSDCKLTVDRIWKVFKDRIDAYFATPMGAIGTVFDLWSYLSDQDIDGAIVADAFHSLVWGGGLLANTFLGDVGTQGFELILALAVNDASSDWQIYEGVYGECTVCFDTEADQYFSITLGSLVPDPALDYVETSSGFAEFRFTFPNDVTLVSGLLQVQTLNHTGYPFTEDQFSVKLYDAEDVLVAVKVDYFEEFDGAYTWQDYPFSGAVNFRYAVFRKRHVNHLNNDLRGSLCVIGV